MRIHSITVRNYRIHRDLTVELDSSRTVIGGPNESGKSTLMEAAHRALFLKAKVTGEGQKSMVSDHHQGHPEVEVVFETDGKTYRIAKRFSGTTGTTSLTEEGAGSWSGDEAESRLAELLEVDPPTGGRGIVERSATQWGHLWVRQGQSGDDPAGHATEQADALLANLQEKGGAAAMQSEFDSRLAREFAAQCDEIFTGAGKPKARSDLAEATQQLETAQADLETARAELKALRGAAEQLSSAEDIIRQAAEALPTLKEQAQATEKSLATVAELRHRLETEELKAQQAKDKLDDLRKADGNIKSLRTEIGDKSTRLQPAQAQEEKLTTHEKDARARAQDAGKLADAAAENAQAVRKNEKLARAWVRAFECGERQEKLEGQMKKVRALKGQLQKSRNAIASLPPVDAKVFKRIEKLAAKSSEAQVALQSMSTGIEVVSSSETVSIDGEEMSTGEQTVLNEEREIQIGKVATLRIVPGGGSSLMEARAQAQSAETALRDALDDAGVQTVEEASTALAKRQELEKEADRTSASIEGQDPESLEEQLSLATTDLEGARAAVEQRRSGLVVSEDPDDLASAQKILKELDSKLEECELAEKQGAAERKKADTALDKASNKLKEHRKSIATATTELENLRARLGVLLETHGEDDPRHQVLENLKGEDENARAKLTKFQGKLDALQPDQIESDQKRFKRAIEKAEAERGQAEKDAAVARHTLSSDGASNPEAAMEIAEAEEDSAREHHAIVQRHAEAIKLLADLFSEEQRSLAEEFTGPLAEKVSGYLQCLFGPQAHASIVLTDRSFEGLRLARPKGTYAFDELSGGAREQTAAAFRLAMAEILAEDHHGSLPVVFDDAFTNSDPDRVQALQRMLDLGATRGLQVIVLTCDPADYAALGAELVSLSQAVS